MAKPKPPERLAAEASGAHTYEGAPCPHGHTLRYTNRSQCVTCTITRATTYVKHNPERRKRYNQRWYADNRAIVMARSAGWREQNPERFRESLRVWFSANPEIAKTHQRNRRARERGCAGRHSAADSRLILALQNGHCAYCDETENLHLDHVIPLSRGGSDWPWNLQWLCAWHNLSKHAMTDSEYRLKIDLKPAEPISLKIWMHTVLIGLFFT